MKNTLFDIGDCITALIKSSHLTVNLQGWPAAVAVVALCTGGVAIYAIKVVKSAKADSEMSDSSQQRTTV